MPAEPAVKRTIAFFDGQNLFYAAKYAFGYAWPNYDPRLLAENICQAQSLRPYSDYKDSGLAWLGAVPAKVAALAKD